MRRKTINILIVFFALAFNCLGLDYSIKDSWKGIRTLRTDRKTAEKILGKYKDVTKNGFFNYETENFLAQVNYSNQPCEKSSYDRGDYNVPAETVISYTIRFHELTKLEDLKFQRKKYRREEDSHAMRRAYYINEDAAIVIDVGTMPGDEIEYVGEIRFFPTLEDKKKLKCENSKTANVGVSGKSKNNIPAKKGSKTKFSSVYTKLGPDNCQFLPVPESEKSKISLLCAGYKDYKIYIDTRGSGTFYIGREITEDVNSWFNLGLPSFLLGLDKDIKVEWRLANGKPFACLIRLRYDSKTVNPNQEGIATEIFVRNLRGFAPINFKVDTYYNYDAVDEARIRADEGYRKL